VLFITSHLAVMNKRQFIPDVIGETDQDDVPEIPAVAATSLGDIWNCGRHRVMCGDSTSHANLQLLLDGGKADMSLPIHRI